MCVWNYRMKQPVFMTLLSALFLGSLSTVQGWTADFCHEQECPEFTVVEKNENFEERAYKPSRWITINVPGASKDDVKAGLYKLYYFCDGQNDNGDTLPCKYTWPSLVTMTEGEDGEDREVSVSFYIPPGTDLPKLIDPSIREETWPACTIYVRTFGGIPTVSNGQTNVKNLWESLNAAGKAFVPQRFSGAGYDSPWSLFHHNEVWVHAA